MPTLGNLPYSGRGQDPPPSPGRLPALVPRHAGAPLSRSTQPPIPTGCAPRDRRCRGPAAATGPAFLWAAPAPSWGGGWEGRGMRVPLEQLIREPHFKPLTLLWKPERGMRAAAAGAAGPQGMAGWGRHVEGQPVSLSPRRLLPRGEPRLRARRGHAGWHPREVAVPSQPPWLDTGYSSSGCRLVCAVLCDTSRQLPPLPRGGRAARVLYCL